MFPGFVGASVRDKRALVGAAVFGLLFGFVQSWRATTLVAEAKSGSVVVLDQDGNRAAIPVYSAAEWRLSDGNVIFRLQRMLTCVRGLDESPKVVRDCWEESSPMFQGEAKRPFEVYAEERIPNLDALQTMIQRERVEVVFGPYSKPDRNKPGMFWLPWTEIHYPRGGAPRCERWSGTFYVTLLPVDLKSQSLGMRIDRFAWQHDPGRDGDCKAVVK